MFHSNVRVELLKKIFCCCFFFCSVLSFLLLLLFSAAELQETETFTFSVVMSLIICLTVGNQKGGTSDCLNRLRTYSNRGFALLNKT